MSRLGTGGSVRLCSCVCVDVDVDVVVDADADAVDVDVDVEVTGSCLGDWPEWRLGVELSGGFDGETVVCGPGSKGIPWVFDGGTACVFGAVGSDSDSESLVM